MTTRTWVLGVVLVIGVAVYVVAFTGLFAASPPVELLVRQTPSRNGPDVTVGLVEAHPLKRVTVERVDDGSVAWQLAGDPASQPTKAVRYGGKVKNMVEEIAPTPLQPGVEYRVIVVASSGTGQMQFTAKGRG